MLRESPFLGAGIFLNWQQVLYLRVVESIFCFSGGFVWNREQPLTITIF